jgi:co-chaperonin GroES (HSP10)
MIIVKEKVESVRPLKNFAKVKVIIPSEIKTESGLVLVDSTRFSKFFTDIEIYEGEILELSAGAEKLNDGFFKVGDKVIFDRLAEVTISTVGDDCIKLVEVGMLIVKNDGAFGEFAIKSLTPFMERVIVKVEPLPSITAGGIIIPSSANRASVLDRSLRKGTVMSVAQGVDEVVLGDVVIFEDVCGVPMVVGLTEYRILVKYDLFAIIEK